MEFECVWCHRKIEVDRAGWAYIQSVALLHFHTCSQRPLNVSSDTIQRAAGRVADTLDDAGREINGRK